MANKIASLVMGNVRDAYRAKLRIMSKAEEEIHLGAISAVMALLGNELSNTLKIVHNVLMEIVAEGSLVVDDKEEVKRRLRSVMSFMMTGAVDATMMSHLERIQALAEEASKAGDVQDPPNESGEASEDTPAPAP